jgi:glycosyltransferase involved in cell wall biosynthesis
MVSATVVICTHDREDILARAVEGALAEVAACGADLLIVDNASTDRTPAVAAELAARHPGRIRVAHEPRLGLSAARNRGLAEARGEIAVYLDDDAIPRRGWLAALLAPYAERAVACVGGRIHLHFALAPPAWLTPALHGAFSAYDLGDAPRRLTYRPGDLYPFGANVSFRVADARALGGFSTWVGPLGRRPLVHDETDLCFRLDHAGREIRYAPAAAIDHWVFAERLTPAFLLARYRAGGESGAAFEVKNRGLWRALGKLRWYYRPRFTLRPYTPREPIDPARMLAECERQEAIGYVIGLGRALRHLRAMRREMQPIPARPAPALASAAGRASER